MLERWSCFLGGVKGQLETPFALSVDLQSHTKAEGFKNKFLIDKIDSNWGDSLAYEIHFRVELPPGNFSLESMASKCRGLAVHLPCSLHTAVARADPGMRGGRQPRQQPTTLTHTLRQ